MSNRIDKANRANRANGADGIDKKVGWVLRIGNFYIILCGSQLRALLSAI
jgi:hypothetical protein